MANINGKEFPEQIIEKIISDIKEKRELGAIEESFVRDILIRELQSNQKIVSFILEHELRTLSRADKYKEIIKRVRAKLRVVYGVFQTGKESEKLELLEELKKVVWRTKEIDLTIDIHKKLLEKHLSSKERLPYYEEVYRSIWRFTGKPHSIIDLGCGLNPLSFPFMGLNKVDYYASELNTIDVNFLNAYFDIMEVFGLNGKAIQQDLSGLSASEALFKTFPKSDVAFMFKLLDSLKVPRKSKKLDEMVIDRVPARWVIVSFPTKTIGSRSMSVTQRGWVEKLCQRKGWKCSHIKVGDEIFYIIKKF